MRGGTDRVRSSLPSPRRVGALLAITSFLLLPVAAQAAAGIDGFAGVDDSALLRDQGWRQVTNLPEMLEFLIAVVTAAVLTAAIAYHPVILSERRSREDYQEPRSLFMYALIGLLVGFMVMHHGYLIGFVIFGIGGLMRVKTDTEDIGDTRRLILVTLLGLSVGLNLPVMATIATACACVIIWVLGRKMHVTVEVQFESMKLMRLHMDTLRDLLRERGFDVLAMSKQRFKSTTNYIVVVPGAGGRSNLVREMTSISAAKLHGISDWHVD